MSAGPLFVVSILAGVIGAVGGMGGGVVLIPILTSCGLDIKHAIAISIISVMAISSSAASNYVKGHLANLKVSAFLELFAVVGALIGASLTLAANPRRLFLLCGALFFTSWMVLWKQRGPEGEGILQPDALSGILQLNGSYYDAGQRQTIHYHGTRAALGGMFMFGAGLVAGLLGIGGSAFTVLIQHAVMRLPPKVAVTTSNLIMGSVALAGASVYLEARLIDSKLLAPVILGVFLGAFVGSKMLIRLPSRVIRRTFLSLLAVLGLEMILHGIRGAS